MEIRCYYCKKWFTPKRKNALCCSPVCSARRSYTLYNRSNKGHLRKMLYYRSHKKKIQERRKLRDRLKSQYYENWKNYINAQGG